LEHVIFIVIIVGFERRGGVCVGGGYCYYVTYNNV